MKYILTICVSLMLCANASGVSKIDTALQKKILLMFRQDQKWRIESDKINNGKSSAYDEATINKNMAKTDSLNMMEAKLIIKKHGYPGYNLVDTSGSNAFWAIIQHCDDDVAFQQQALTLMSREIKRHNANGEDYALLQDRVLVNQGHKQLYGTQVRIDLKTHHAKPFPIQDSLQVDKRRKAVGLIPLQDYLKIFEPKQ